MKAGGIRRRCGCRDESGRQLGSACPKLRLRNHGTVSIRQELHPTTSGARRSFRRSGYATTGAAQADLDRVRALLSLAEDDTDREAISAMLARLATSGDPLPEVEDVRRQIRGGIAPGSQLTVGEWLDQWLAQESHRPATSKSYADHVRLHLVPAIGHIKLDRLQVRHLVEMFAKIHAANETVLANNSDRGAIELRIEQAPKRGPERRALHEQLAAMPPYRRPVGPATQNRIRSTLRAAINDAITQQLVTFNPAAHVEVPTRRPKAIIWTAERVAEWARTGIRPSPVMVWTPQQTGAFLDYVVSDDLAAMWRVAAFSGLRRGELCGLRPGDVDLDAAVIEIGTQLTEVGYAVIEGEPKSESGTRTVPLDAATVTVLRAYRHRQKERRVALGLQWTESGRFFTMPTGEALRPSWVSARFARLVTEAGLPPIRLHDLRHGTATLALAAGVDMKIVQSLLGHSTLSTTSDLYTSVLPDVARDAAEATSALVPRAYGEHPGGAS